MPLKPNQIQQLYIWVHPGWLATDREDNSSYALDLYRSWLTFIELLKHEPGSALLETTQVSKDVPIKVKPDWAHLFPGEQIYVDSTESVIIPYEESNPLKYERVSYLERFARSTLGERFETFPLAPFVDGRDQTHRDYLTQRFNTTPRPRPHDNPRFMPQDKRTNIFEHIAIFGLDQTMCVAYQGHDFGLHTIAPNVTTGRAFFETPFGYPLSSGESVRMPTNRESLETWLNQGMIRFKDDNQRREYSERLPSIHELTHN